MPDVDALVIGAGHNGLSAANILAREGMDVLVLEKTNFPGGMAASKELFPGYKHSVGAWALFVLHDQLIELMKLKEHGLELFTPPTSYCTFGSEGDAPFIFYSDEERMAEHILKDHGPQAIESLMEMYAYFDKFREIMDAERIKAPSTPEALIAAAPDQETREILGQLFTGSAVDVIRRFFPDPDQSRVIQGSLAAMAIDGTHLGPYSPGGALSMGYHYTAGSGAAEFRMAKGGIGAISHALVSSLESHGGEIQYKAVVKRFIVEEGRVVGVELRNGETITADVVLSSLDANTTFLKMVGEEHLPDTFVHQVKDIEYKNGYIQIHLTLSEAPVYEGRMGFTNEDDVRWLMAYIESPEQLAQCWEEYRRGEIPQNPVSYFYTPSLVDPSLAPPGKHTGTFFAHYFPYDIPAGKHNEYKQIMADRVIDQMAKHAPNLRDSIDDMVIMTHQYFEKTFGITDGDFSHGLIHPGQMFTGRPVNGWSDYATPLDGLYMCGAACHPGPGVTCAPGHNAAQKVLADRGA